MSDINIINSFISGAAALGYFAIGACFTRFARRTRVRLFQLFALAFFLLAIERLVLLLANPPHEFFAYVYLIRLAAFVVIIAAIIDQNRRRK
jgi:hypothetical protein